MEPETINALVAQSQAAFSSIFDFMFSASIIAIWGPPFALYMVINLMRVALGKGYSPGPAELETYGERLLRDEVRKERPSSSS